jgi:hypothetical protein
MAWVPKVNRHVSMVVTIGGKTRRRPGVITAFATDTNPRIRVGRHGEAYGTASVGVVRRTSTTNNSVPRYTSW